MTEITAQFSPSHITPAAEKLILHWGEMGSRWGVNRTVAQIHALLYLAPRPLHAGEIAETLRIARSNVSSSLRELHAWGITRTTHVLGDRRDYFESITDIWELFGLILAERWRREIEPTLGVVEECVAAVDRSGTDRHIRDRVKDLDLFFRRMETWYRQLISMKPAEMKRAARLGGKMRKLLKLGS